MTGTVEWSGPKPPAGAEFCAMHAGRAKGELAIEREGEIRALPDGEVMHLTIRGPIPLAVTRCMITLPLPPGSASPGMPPALPGLAPVCWDCLTGLRVLKSSLAIAGSGLSGV
jgi:hypothetical protein